MKLFPAVSLKWPLALVCGLLFALAAMACAANRDDPPLIFVAASLADVLTEAADQYEQQTGKRVEFNFGGSTTLATQIARLGAPADGAIFAGQEPVDLLAGAGLVSESDIVVVAHNSLVVVSTDTMPPGDLTSLESLLLGGNRIAIADPDLAPAGVYAREALVSADLWEQLEDRIVPTLDVRAALGAVISGSADLAIVYATDAATEPGLSASTIDTALHEPIAYPAAPIRGADHSAAAQEFFDYLLSPAGQALFAEAGFTAG